MGGDSLSDFLRQLPLQFLLLPVVFGVVYVGLTAFILRRASARRRREKLASNPQFAPSALSMSSAPATPAQPPRRLKIPFGDFLRGQLPDRPSQPAEWTIPSEMRNMPLPDLDMLTAPLPDKLADDEPPAAEAADSADRVDSVDSAQDTIPVTNDSDWVTAVVPVQEEVTTVAPMNTDSSEPKNVQMGDAVEILRVWRDLSDGKLIIQLGSQYYRALNDIPNPDLLRRCVAVIRELWTMVNNLPVRGTGPQQLVPGESAPSAPPAETAAGGMKARMGLLTSEPEPPKPNFFKAAIGQKAVPAAPEPPAGIANSVEEFLQFKLSNTPHLVARSIHIRPAHDQGVRIEVDGHYYDAIGDVIDPDVREFLFALMREWEARH